MNAFHTINLHTNSRHHISINGPTPPRPHKNHQQPTIAQFALAKGYHSKRQLSKFLRW